MQRQILFYLAIIVVYIVVKMVFFKSPTRNDGTPISQVLKDITAAQIPVKDIVAKKGVLRLKRENGTIINFSLEVPIEPFSTKRENHGAPQASVFLLGTYPVKLEGEQDLDGKDFSFSESQFLGSIYLDGVYNPVSLRNISFKKSEEKEFLVECKLMINFKSAGIGRNEALVLSTTVSTEDVYILPKDDAPQK